jgi:hypothetical protein
MLSNSYWEIDDIIMTQDPISIKLLKDCEFLQKLKSVQEINENNPYIQNEIVKVPISVALILSAPLQNDSEEVIASIENPSFLTDDYYNILNADPTVPDLSKKNKYFYEKVLLLLNNVDIDSEKWIKIIIKSLTIRFIYYYKNSLNIQLVNTTVDKHSSNKELKFFKKMVSINNNMKYFRENYNNNNNNLDEKIKMKKNRMKIKTS